MEWVLFGLVAFVAVETAIFFRIIRDEVRYRRAVRRRLRELRESRPA